MAQKRLPYMLAFLSLMVSVGFALIPRVPAQAQAFNLPNRGTPGSTIGGGTRSSCVESEKSLTALIPERSLGLTVAAQPTFIVYMPRTQAQIAEFVLKDSNENELYRAMLPIPATPGITALPLPANKPLPELEVGKDYHWYVAIICKPDDRREDVFVDAWIQRMSPNTALTEKLAKATPEERPGVYAKAGIWYEALATLADLRRSRPTDTAIATNWRTLLKSVGLDEMTEETVLNPAPKTAMTAPQ